MVVAEVMRCQFNVILLVEEPRHVSCPYNREYKDSNGMVNLSGSVIPLEVSRYGL